MIVFSEFNLLNINPPINPLHQPNRLGFIFEIFQFFVYPRVLCKKDPRYLTTV